MTMALVSLYIIIAAISLVATYREGRRTIASWTPGRIIGLASCFIWPVVLAAALLVKAEQHYGIIGLIRDIVKANRNPDQSARVKTMSPPITRDT